MGWQDRDYSRSRYESGGFGRKILGFLNGSVSLGEWFGIRVRVHATLIILIAVNLLFSNSRGGMGIRDALTSSVILFGIVLLHEFGHCFAARHVGGDADEILLWPLGGLAFIRTPQRPWPSFIGHSGGLFVNLLIGIITGFALLAMSRFQFSLPINPLLAFGNNAMLSSDSSYSLIYSNNIAYYLWWIYSVNFALFFFNLLPIFPLDGGRILQTILWPRFGFYNSMNFACVTGMAAAVLMGLVGLAGNSFLLFLAIAGFMTCYQTRMTLREQSDAVWFETRYESAGRRTPKIKKKKVRRDDDFSWRDLNPFERVKRARRKKQFQRLFEDDDK
ncbi:MAG TPA: site-2 protease family protein [Abditibacteriaceae bacterium]|jgi:Zn-dependent protease